jgi:hypothetical protein
LSLGGSASINVSATRPKPLQKSNISYMTSITSCISSLSGSLRNTSGDQHRHSQVCSKYPIRYGKDGSGSFMVSAPSSKALQKSNISCCDTNIMLIATSHRGSPAPEAHGLRQVQGKVADRL